MTDRRALDLRKAWREEGTPESGLAYYRHLARRCVDACPNCGHDEVFCGEADPPMTYSKWRETHGRDFSSCALCGTVQSGDVRDVVEHFEREVSGEDRNIAAWAATHVRPCPECDAVGSDPCLTWRGDTFLDGTRHVVRDAGSYPDEAISGLRARIQVGDESASETFSSVILRGDSAILDEAAAATLNEAAATILDRNTE